MLCLNCLAVKKTPRFTLYRVHPRFFPITSGEDRLKTVIKIRLYPMSLGEVNVNRY